MDVVLFLARIFLAVVFALAGVAKLFDLQGSKKAITDFGAPHWLAAPLGYGLPILEITAACLLVFVRTALWGAFGSLTLLIAFVLVIGVNIARGRRPDCHCFGQLHSEPIGLSTLLRNGFLAVVAAALLWLAPHQPSLSFSAAMSRIFVEHTLTSLFAGAFLVTAVVQGYLTLHLFRQNGRLLLRIEALESAPGNVKPASALQPVGLVPGSPAPSFELPLARGETASLQRLLALGKPVFLVFSDAACGPCKALMPELVRWHKQHSERLTFAVVTRGVSKEKPKSQPNLEYIFIQKDREVANQYRAFGTPSAVVIGKDGSVLSPLASGTQAISALVLAASAGSLPAPVVRSMPRTTRDVLLVGTPCPQLSLPDLSGKTVSLADFLGHEILLLFWNPACGFCARMLPRLKELEPSLARTKFRIVLISAGSREQNEAMKLGSPVLLAQDRGAMELFGASGTPAGLLLDRTGKIGSALAVGADAIFALVGNKKPIVVGKTGMTFQRAEQQAI